MPMAPQDDEIVGGTALRIPAIQSPNYVAGSTGWIINGDGTAEFNSGTFRGSIEVGPVSGAHFIVNNSATGDVIDVYDSSNRLVFSIDADGNSTSYSPASLGDPYVRFHNGQQQFNNASGLTTTDPPTISAPTIAVGGTQLEVFSGTPDGSGHASALQLFGGTSSAGSEIRATQRDVTGDVLQLDTSNNDRQLIHLASYSGTTGGTGHLVANHGCSFTPKGMIITQNGSPGPIANLTWGVVNLTSTQFDVFFIKADTNVAWATQPVSFYAEFYG